jgi:hypothetical protein
MRAFRFITGYQGEKDIKDLGIRDRRNPIIEVWEVRGSKNHLLGRGKGDKNV